MPAIRTIAKAIGRRRPDLAHDDLTALVEVLWSEPVHERRMLAVALLELHAASLRPEDLSLLERLLRESRTWALVDGLAASVIGPLVEFSPEMGPVLDRWAADDDFWIRRSALLALLPGLRRGAGDFGRFCRYADLMLGEQEFFIRKAIGWVLRETARKRPEIVFDWLRPRARQASGITLREAVKPMSAEQRAAILAAR
jgi:3-methyladenine DNA glycosylase AlkD